MSRSLGIVCLVALGLLSGCVAGAKDQFARLEVGMTRQQVQATLGPPEEVKQVRFKGHDDYYEVWQYQMVPDTPLCPSEAVPRFISDVATLGLAEIAWTHAQASAHWIYFLDGAMVYTSPAFDCLGGELCMIRRGRSQTTSQLRR